MFCRIFVQVLSVIIPYRLFNSLLLRCWEESVTTRCQKCRFQAGNCVGVQGGGGILAPLVHNLTAEYSVYIEVLKKG